MPLVLGQILFYVIIALILGVWMGFKWGRRSKTPILKPYPENILEGIPDPDPLPEVISEPAKKRKRLSNAEQNAMRLDKMRLDEQRVSRETTQI